MVEGTGNVKVVGRMDDESVIHTDGDERRTRSLGKNGEDVREGERTDGQVPLTPIARLGTPKPSGLTL